MTSSERNWTVAAVIPTYNRATLLARSIDSVLAQRRPPDEIIVVDDGSSDNTEEVVRAYGDALIFVQKRNGGVSSARNAGVKESRADFMAFLDSDDLWYDEHLSRIADAIGRTEGRAGLYFSDLRLAPSRRGSSAWRWAGFSIDGSYELQEDGRRWAFLANQPMTIQGSVIRRDAYLSAGGCDESLTCREDTHLLFKLALLQPICAVAGYAGLLTGDDAESLTNTLSPANATYLHCTAYLYDDLLHEYGGRLTLKQRHILARRLADAHWVLARNSSGRRLLHHLGRVLLHDPVLVPRRLSQRARTVATGARDSRRSG